MTSAPPSTQNPHTMTRARGADNENRQRLHRMAFDVSEWERRLLADAARSVGLSSCAWQRTTLLAAARAVFADSTQHPTLYPRLPAPPPASPAPPPPAPPEEPPTRQRLPALRSRSFIEHVAPPETPTRQRPPRPWEPYGEPARDPEDTDGLDDPSQVEIPGVGKVHF